MTDMPSDLIGNTAHLLDIVCEALPAAVLAYDRNDQILFASKQILNFYSLPTDVIMPGARLRDLLGAIFDSRSRSYSSVAKGVSAREDWVAERLALHWRERHELTELYGYGRYARLVKRRFPNGTGLCVITDVSEHHKREEQWRADMARVQLTEEVLDNIPFPVFVKDANLAYVAVNRAFCSVRGVPAEEILGRTIHGFASEQVAEYFEAADREVLATGEMITLPKRLVRPNGDEIAVLTRKVRIGRPGHYHLVTTMEDVGDTKDSHGREPWHMLDFESEYIPEMQSASDTLSGHSLMAKLPPPVETILPDVFTTRRALLACSDVTVEAQASRVLEHLNIDFCCVKSVLEQEAFLHAAAERGIDIDVMIIDSQMDPSSLELAEHHGINVLVMDGSRMVAELAYQLIRHFNSPWGRPKNGRNPLSDLEIETIAVPQIPLSMVDVLVAEDNPVNQIVFSQILEGLGYTYRIADTGRDALKLAPELLPRIVLLDQSLPDMSGLDLVRRIREADPALDKVPVVGVIVATQGPDPQECLAAGMSATMMKPISPESVEGVLRRFLAPEESAAVA